MSGRDLRIAALLVGLALGVYACLMGAYLRGYEGETAAVAEGIALDQRAEVPEVTQLTLESAGEAGRTGILQPALMLPFYAVGAGLDEATSNGDDYTYRSFMSRLYGAAISALTVALMFLIMRALGRDERWSLLIAALYGFASIALPYAGIGMEPTSTAVVMTAFLVAIHAARTRSPWLFALTGIAVGLAASTRPTTLLPAAAALILLWPPLRDAGAGERRRLAVAAALPLVLGGLAYLGYNVVRFDDPFGNAYDAVGYKLEASTAVLGLFLSPGKGLLWYSPLVILGALGIASMWSSRRTLAVALIAGLALGTAPFLTHFWADETWGPRYLVSVAWIPLVAIPWWVTTAARRIALAAVTALAVWVQLAGTLVNFNDYSAVLVSGERTGAQVYGHYAEVEAEDVPYGDDPIRWVPALSPIRFHSEAMIGIAAEAAGLDAPDSRYEPFKGFGSKIDVGYVEPFVWWNGSQSTLNIPKPTSLWLLPFGLIAAGSGYGLWRMGAGRGSGAAAQRSSQNS